MRTTSVVERGVIQLELLVRAIANALRISDAFRTRKNDKDGRRVGMAGRLMP